MILLIVSWVLIGGVAILIGHGLLTAVDGGRKRRMGDWLVLSLWLGLSAWTWLAAVLAIMGPVTPARMAAALIGAVALAFHLGRQSFASRAKELLDSRPAIALAFLALMAAFVAAQLRATPDTGAYHFPVIRWLAEHGQVTGLAHILQRFGFISSTLAFVAPFDTLFEGQLNSVLNGLILLLLGGHAVIAASRIATATAQPSDIFLGTASVGLAIIGILIGSFSTPSPDPMVAALTVVIAWQMLAGGNASLRPSGALLPMVLACGALNAKLSALMLLPVVVLADVLGRELRFWLARALLCVFLVSPFFVASVKASGCLALPAAITCLPVDWALPVDTVKELARLLTLFTQWDSQIPESPGRWSWIPGWLIGTRFWLNPLVFWPFVFSTAAFFCLARGNITRGEAWVLALITPSLLLVFAVAPEVRYNLGLFLAPVALLAARVWRPGTALADGGWTAPLCSAATMAATVVAVSVAIEYRKLGYLGIVSRILAPPSVPVPKITSSAGSGLAYYKVPTESCWRAPLPCSHYPLTSVALRSPARGIAGGFRSR